MDKKTLVKECVEEGKELIKALDETQFEVRAAMWFYLSDSDEWRLFIASPYVEEKGPKKAYSFIQSKLETLSPSEISLKNISVLSHNHDLINLLRKAIQTGPGISDIRFTQNVIDNKLIEDAYIYRML